PRLARAARLDPMSPLDRTWLLATACVFSAACLWRTRPSGTTRGSRTALLAGTRASVAGRGWTASPCWATTCMCWTRSTSTAHRCFHTSLSALTCASLALSC
ncbi:hypothetical protein IWW35_006835, partial [Coemansia sp. RSA 1878]